MALSGFQITRITINELNKLLDLSRQTFVETFAQWNTAENMQHYLDNHLSASQIENELLNPDSEFYFASIGDQLAGYLKLNRQDAQTVQAHANGLEIERIYVLTEMKGKKIGQAFIQKAVDQQFYASVTMCGSAFGKITFPQ